MRSVALSIACSLMPAAASGCATSVLETTRRRTRRATWRRRTVRLIGGRWRRRGDWSKLVQRVCVHCSEIHVELSPIDQLQRIMIIDDDLLIDSDHRS